MSDFSLRGVWRLTAAPAPVWDVLVDLSAWRDWWPALKEAEQLTADVAAGRTGEIRMRFDAPMPLRGFDVDAHVVAVETPTRIVVRSTGGALEGEGELRLEPDGDGSAVHYRFDVEVGALWLRPVRVVLGRAGRRGGRERLARAGRDLAHMAGGESRGHEVTSA